MTAGLMAPIAPAQHLQMAQMRARETGKAVVFATNSGITAVINPLGHIIKQLPQRHSCHPTKFCCHLPR